jgi:hypothetical protein
MSATSESIGSLVIDLRANVAQLRVDMDAIKSEVQKSSRQMSSQMRQDMNETRQVLALMRDDFGVGVPRELRKVIASSELARNAILGIKDALFGLAFLNLGIEVFKKIMEFADGMKKANEEIQKQIKEELALHAALELTNKAHEERLRVIGLIGKSQEEQYKSNAEHMQEELNAQRAKLMGMKEELGFLQAFKVENAKKAFNENVLPAMGDRSPEQQRAALQSMIAEAMKVPQEVQKELNKANNDYLVALDALAAFKANHSEQERQDNKKTAEEQQKDLEQTIVKVKELQQKDIETLDPLKKAALEWENIRATQALILEKHPDIQEHVRLIGTLTAQWRAEQKIITEETAKLPGELQKGLAIVEQIAKAQGQSAVGDMAGSMGTGGKPQLRVDMKGAAVDRFASNFKDAAAQGKLLEKAMDDLLTPMDKFRIEQQEIEILKEKFRDYPEAIKALDLELLKANPDFQKLMEASAEFGKDFANELDNLALKGESFHDFLVNIAKDIEEIALKALLLKPLEDFFSGKGGGSGGGITSLLGSLFSGLHFAGGGSPPVGQLSLVGENGPELFMPSSSGTIIPNGALGGDHYTFYIDAKGAAPGTEAAIIRGLKRSLEETRRQSIAGAVDYQRRR